jgi:hypothetical protein
VRADLCARLAALERRAGLAQQFDAVLVVPWPANPADWPAAAADAAARAGRPVLAVPAPLDAETWERRTVANQRHLRDQLARMSQ